MREGIKFEWFSALTGDDSGARIREVDRFACSGGEVESTRSVGEVGQGDSARVRRLDTGVDGAREVAVGVTGATGDVVTGRAGG